MNNPGFSTMQRSKKALIFTYLFFIAVFFAISVLALYLKSAYFAKVLDMSVGMNLASNGLAKCHYKVLSGDLLSGIEITGLRAVPDSHGAGRLFAAAEARSISFTAYPVRHFFRYASLTSIPLDFSASGITVSTASGTVETGLLYLKTFSDYHPSSGSLEVSFKAGADIVSDFFSARLPEPVFAEGRVSFAFAPSSLFASAALKAEKFSVSPGLKDLAGNSLSLDVRRLAANLAFTPPGTLCVDSAGFTVGTGRVEVSGAKYDLRQKKAFVRANVRNFDSDAFFREHPLLPFMVMAKSGEASFEFEGPADDARAGVARLSAKFIAAKVLEYDLSAGRIFSPAGFGDFVTSLGLAPEIACNAGTIEVDAAMDGRKIFIKRLEILSPDYNFKGAVTAGADDRLEGSIRLHIVKRVLLNNTINVDFSSMEDGLTISGLVCGTISEPFVIYNMDKAALMKITGDVMMNKFRDYFKGGKENKK